MGIFPGIFLRPMEPSVRKAVAQVVGTPSRNADADPGKDGVASLQDGAAGLQNGAAGLQTGAAPTKASVTEGVR
jgi:hypothetical protein